MPGFKEGGTAEAICTLKAALTVFKMKKIGRGLLMKHLMSIQVKTSLAHLSTIGVDGLDGWRMN